MRIVTHTPLSSYFLGIRVERMWDVPYRFIDGHEVGRQGLQESSVLGHKKIGFRV